MDISPKWMINDFGIMKNLISKLFLFCLLAIVPLIVVGKNCMSSYFVTPEDFGCVSDDPNKAILNSAKLQEMIDYASKEGVTVLSSANKKYYIAKSLIIREPITIEFNRGRLIATDTINMVVIDRSGKNNKLYSGKISGLYLDLNKKAKTGMDFLNAVKVHTSECWIFGVPKSSTGINVVKGGEMFFDHIHIEGGERGANGFKIETHDCHFSDCVMINCYVAIDNKGSNFFERIHAWMEDGRWIPGGCFFKIRGGGPIYVHQCFSDTFDKSFQIERKTKLFISQQKNFHNINMWKWTPDMSTVKPHFFYFPTPSVSEESYIVLSESCIDGLTIGGINYQRFSNEKKHKIKIFNSIINVEK